MNTKPSGRKAICSKTQQVPQQQEFLNNEGEIDAIGPDDLRRLLSIALNNQIVSIHQRAGMAGPHVLDERSLLLMELLADYEINERSICRIFGVQYSSASLMVKKLNRSGLVEKKEGKKRGVPYRLTDKGRTLLYRYRELQANRLRYNFRYFKSSEEVAVAKRFLPLVEKAAADQVRQEVFDLPIGLGESTALEH